MKSYALTFLSLLAMIFYSNSLKSQCFELGGIGDFEVDDIATHYFNQTEGRGTFNLSTSEKYTGDKSLHVNVNTDSPWQVRMYNNSPCWFTKSEEETVTISFYAKGDIGGVVNVALLNNSGTESSEDITITSTDWKLYVQSFLSTEASTQCKIRLAFEKAGDYYVDNIELNTYDCNNELGGSAAFDDCGICAGGSTGLAPIADCSLQTIDPTNTNILFEGANEVIRTASRATLYRFKKYYAETSYAGYYSSERAVASSGITVRFKTTSPTVKLYFEENLTLGPDIFWHTFDVYKNGEFQFDAQGWNIDLDNPTQELTEWEITLPTFSMVDFLRMEILTGFSLEPISKDKPVYVAIGNSITHGMGIDSFSTRKTYPHRVADSLGYELYNWGIGGSKITDTVMDNFTTGLDPNLVTVLWGYNDVHSFAAAEEMDTKTYPMYEKLLDRLATSFPDACIMAILSTYTRTPTGRNGKTIGDLRTRQEEIIQNLQLRHSNISYFNGGDYTDDGGLNDDVHMNYFGNRDLANGIIQELPCPLLGVAIDQINESDMTVYPNPTNGILQWEKSLPYEFFDAKGRLLDKGVSNQTNISELGNGVYFLKLGVNTFPIVKK